MALNIGLNEETQRKVVEALQVLLADEIALYLKTRNFHWNVEGPAFYELHKLFEEQYEQLDETMDEVAERIRMIGGYAAGSMQEFTKRTKLPEVPGTPRTDVRMEQLLLDDHETMITSLRQVIDSLEEWGDAGTQDFVTGILMDHEKMAWMLRATLGRRG